MAPKIKNPRLKSGHKSKTPNPESEIDFLEVTEELEQAGVSDAKSTIGHIQKITELQHELRLSNHAANAAEEAVNQADLRSTVNEISGKWRAGDAAKATRFFQRAIQVYDQGLGLYPQSFDLAYNKAHLQYEISEDERIAPCLNTVKIALLHEALVSHRTALSLNQANIDVQFNTGQVLSSLAETLLETEVDITTRNAAREMLEEACNLFTNCLGAQQRQYELTLSELAELHTKNGGSLPGDQSRMTESHAAVDAQNDMMETAGDSSTTEEWAIVEEALTPQSILETCTAQLGALTTLLGLYDLQDLTTLEQRTKDGLNTANIAIPALITQISTASLSASIQATAGPTMSVLNTNTEIESASSQKYDALLAATIFQAAVAEVSYRTGNTSTAQYSSTLSSLFSSLTNSSQSPLNQIAQKSAYADALIDLAVAVSDIAPDVETQWNALTQAQGLLTQLCSPSNSVLLATSRLADIFVARAETDLVRFNISFLNEAKPGWKSSRNVLISNAGVFYRGAKTYAEKAGNDTLARSANAMAVVAEILKQIHEHGFDAVVVKAGWKEQDTEVKRVLELMVNERTLGRREAEEVLRIVTG